MKCPKILMVLSYVIVIAGCTVGPDKRETPASFDFGPPRVVASTPAINATLLIPAVQASPWLDSSSIIYRLNYRDAGRAEVYAQNRWTMTPALLLTERLRTRFAAAARGVVTPQDGAKADVVLRIELDDFSQSFEDEKSSAANVRLRATLIDANTRTLRAQRAFSVARPAAPNAPGAAQALAAASDALIEDLAVWAAQTLK